MTDETTRETTNDAAPDEVLVPVQQEIVPFYGRELLAVRLADGRICAVLAWLCEGMGLDTTAQLQRIRRKRALVRDLLMVKIETPTRGAQTLAALALHGLPGWLYGIDETRVKEEAREGVIMFQYEATDALYRYFAERPAELAPPADLIPAENIEKPTRPASNAAPDLLAEYYENMAAWVRWQSDIAAWRQGVEQWREGTENRLESIEELTRLVPEILDRLGPATLTPAHQATVRASVKRLADLTGASYGAIYADLGAAFHVAKYGDIQESEWARVAEWLQTRIHAAEKRQQKH